jgi:uncharacterized membrane protein
MNALRRQQRNHALRTSLWLVPVACMVAAMIAVPLMRWIDGQTHWSVLGFGLEGAKGVVGGLASSLLTFIVFAFSILLLAAQMSAQTMTPRMLSRLFEARRAKATLGALVFTWVYSIGILGRLEDHVPQLAVAFAMLTSLTSVALFLYLVQFAVKSLRPGVVMIRIARDTRLAIDVEYPAPFSSDPPARPDLDLEVGPVVTTIPYRGAAGTLVGLDSHGILAWADRAACPISIAPRIGDFLATGDDLFYLHGPTAAPPDEQALADCVAVGHERHLEHDTMFGIRIIVDIASRALSPAVNDPTTAVLAIDQLQSLLCVLAQRQLEDGILHDASGAPRLARRVPDWEDFVTLAVTEPRIYGAQNPQVTRRLEALFEKLVQRVPAPRLAVVEVQRQLLRETVHAAWSSAGDRAMAAQADLQGFGSRTRSRAVDSP